ncbi:hypothetical protein FPOA_13079 [Fusarium poae]|uniref:Uncharacterized protein n=1 Tax=Fusarium poae TaxID=36050 RepID=A0A1B8A732_FUSPO|nr:hypothetical protein FPOA_13079 [Fusarium poae]
MDEVIAASEARLKEKDAARLRKGDLKEDIDRDSSWVKRVGWVRHFGSRDLTSIHDAAEWLRARTATGRRTVAQDDEEAVRELLLLGRLGQSFNREVERCCWRLDSVPTETLQWLASISSTTPSGQPFGRKGKEASMIKYKSVGHRQAGDPFHVHRPRIHGVEMDGPCIHFHPFNGAGRYIIHPSTPGFRGMDRWKWKQGDGLVGGSLA